MNEKFKGKAKRLISGFVAAATAITMLPAIPAMAEELGRYPYTLFAGSSSEGAITTTASNFGVNGNVATNGTISAAGNMNINGTKTENAGLDMIYIFDKIDSKYFSGNNVEEHTEDYVLDELNINISEPTEVLGEAELTGNININTALKAFKDVTLNGEVKNTNDSVIYSKYGDIVIDSTNVNLNGLVYAPFGSVEVKAMNLNLNNVVIIADSIVFDCPNVNANYSTNAADFVGTVSEPLNIPKDEWQYMKDENENGLPDFFENFENWSKLADTDGDGLPDSIEEYLGCDPNNIDTDGDGLNDYYEVFGTFTDPTKADTDENGVNDGDEDFDEDGLTNLEEFDNKTNPYIADTDSDGLSDGDEVNTYGTDPLVADTDGDGLDDGDEIVLGTNPLVQDTDGDGIIDSKEKFQQTFTHKVKNDDCAVTEVIVDMECTGNINRTTTVESVMNVDILCTDVVGLVGEPFEIETTSEFDKATLTFKIDKNRLGEIPFDNLLFLWYNEEDNEFVELETMLDEANGTASITTTHFSKYMVVDQQAWFDNWRKIYERFEKLSTVNPSITAICVDCSGSMSWNDKNFTTPDHSTTCYRNLAVKQFAEAMFVKDKTSIITFESSAREVCELTSDKELLKSKANFYSSGGTNANAAINIALQQLSDVSGNKSIILMSDGDINVSNSNLVKAHNNDIRIYAVALGEGANSTALKDCAEKTNGEFFIVKTADELETIYDKLSANNQLNFDYLSDTDGDGVPDDIEISGVPMPSGKLVFLDPTNPDTDNDGLSDGDEVGKMRRGFYVPSDVPDYAVTYKFSFDVTSDPTSVDSDEDGFDDECDPEPLTFNFFINFGSDEYLEDVWSRFKSNDYIWDIYTQDMLWDHSMILMIHMNYKPIYSGYMVDLMISDLNESDFHHLVSDENWDRFCEFFNSWIVKGAAITKERHFIRNQLNRVPNSLCDLICQSERWVLCDADESIYHINGADGEYNLKFVSDCGKYEAVYNKYGVLLTEYNDPVNMGTYNYGSYMKGVTQAAQHVSCDVIPFGIYGNVPGGSKQKSSVTSSNAKAYRSEMQSIMSSSGNNEDKLNAYEQVRKEYIE